jgi:hypothetical protein
VELPRALASWAPSLAMFPREIALSLGPALQRLSFAVGPLRVRRAGDQGDPDGFDGLTHRGSYERLLNTEWLLAEEAPDEFLRRAAGGEHTFLRLARPEPAATRTSVAVFDAGPGQLGAPRIAQIAALIVLARRAEAAGARFAWGILQEPEGTLLPGATQAGLLRLLQSRTAHEATEAQVAAWHARMEGWREWDDFWIVGSRRLSRIPTGRGASVLEVWDVLEPGERRVGVAVRRGSASPLELVLELPEDRDCARLLRDPFGAAATTLRRLPAEYRPVSNLLFSANGSKLLARTAQGGVVAFPVPNSPRTDPGPALCYPAPPDAPVTAAGFVGRTVALVTAREGGALLHRGYRRSEGLHRGELHPEGSRGPFRPAPFGAPLRACFAAGGVLYAQDGEGSLFQLGAGGPAERVAGPVSAVAVGSRGAEAAGERPVFVEIARPEAPARIARIGEDGRPVTVLTLAGSGERAFFGWAGRLAHPEAGLVAVDEGGGRWIVLWSGGATEVTVPDGARIAGLWSHPRRRGPGLVELELGRRLRIHGAGWSEHHALAATHDVEEIATSSAAPRVAWLAEAEICVASLEGERLVRLALEGPGEAERGGEGVR